MLVVVALGAQINSEVLLNAAARKAKKLGVGWHVIHVQTPVYSLKNDTHRQMVLRYLTIAEEKGATIHRIEARTVISGILRFLADRSQETIELYMGKSTVGFGHKLLARRQLHEKLKSRLPSTMTIHAIPVSDRTITSGINMDLLRVRSLKPSHLFYALLSVAGAYAATEALRSTMTMAEFAASSYNANIIFLLPPVFISLRYGLIPGLLSALCGFAVLHEVYISPVNPSEGMNYQTTVNIALFVGISFMMALLGSYSYAYAESAGRRERRTQALFTINEVISQSGSRQEALRYLHQTLVQMFEMDVAFFLPSLMRPDVVDLAYPQPMEPLSDVEYAALQDSWYLVHTNGCGTPRFTDIRWRFEPMITGHDRFGVLGIKIPRRADLDAGFGQLVAVLADQCGSVLHRLELSKELENKRVSEERERLRSMLLSSVSHDLKTPLASIIGSLSVYHGMFDTLSITDKRELTETALEEAQRLDSFITNILDMTRIESGQIQFRREWTPPLDMVHRVCRRLQHRLQHHRVHMAAMVDSVEVECDCMMTEQVLQNVIDNAAKYTAKGTPIEISFAFEDEHFLIVIRDSGKGIPEHKLKSVFDKYERIGQQDSKVAGTGLGLAIAQAVMEAQSGSIAASNHPDGGAVFTLRFSIWRRPALAMEEAS